MTGMRRVANRQRRGRKLTDGYWNSLAKAAIRSISWHHISTNERSRSMSNAPIRTPCATIHTLRELLEDDGYDKYAGHIAKLEGSARAFFENEFRGKKLQQTRRQVLRRLYGILANQPFERMFSHPKS